MDVEECCCADVYSDGEVIPIFEKHSEVPHKHKKGGQSAARFARIRDNEITLWFKRINMLLNTINDEVYLGINSIYKNRLIKTLSVHTRCLRA